MGALLDAVYSIAMLALAVLGTGYVFFGTTDSSGTETRLSDASVVIAVAVFLGVMVGALLIS